MMSASVVEMTSDCQVVGAVLGGLVAKVKKTVPSSKCYALSYIVR